MSVSPNNGQLVPMRKALDVQDHVNGIRQGRREALARAITLIESTTEFHRQQAQSVLQALLPDTGRAIRVGVSGVPGVGKSTFIEALGQQLLDAGHRLAVLAIDPSSRRTGGSILGDKTRMPVLSSDTHCFVRPSPAGTQLGGVNRVTRESMLLCEAAGYDVVLVETVGVGQSETLVADMVDCYLVLMLPGAGDELQGIKKGILELADIIAVNKADGALVREADRACVTYERALSILRHSGPWAPRVRTCSAERGDGLDVLWNDVLEHRDLLESRGELARRRQAQQVRWMWALLEQQLLEPYRHSGALAELASTKARQVAAGELTPMQASERLLRER